MKGKIPFTYLNKHPKNGHPNFAVLGKVQKDLKNALHYVWTGRGQIVGWFFGKKFLKSIFVKAKALSSFQKYFEFSVGWR